MPAHGQEGGRTAGPDGHVPVLLEEAIVALQPRVGGFYVDGTFGGGGHTARLAAEIGQDGRIFAFDRDPDAAERATALDEAADAEIIFIQQPFADMTEALRSHAVDQVDGVLFDLGISSIQLDDPVRGFSFLRDGPLDMRLDPTRGESAAELLERLPEGELVELLFDYGEERQARRIARAITRELAANGIRTTTDLAQLIDATIGRRPGTRIHPATRTFQALRIAVNDELGELEAGLEAVLDVLRPGGRLVVISFHSLEDRIAKQFIAREVKGCICPPEQPVCTCGRSPRLKTIGRPVRPTNAEIDKNPRARSAIMRVAERLP